MISRTSLLTSTKSAGSAWRYCLLTGCASQPVPGWLSSQMPRCTSCRMGRCWSKQGDPGRGQRVTLRQFWKSLVSGCLLCQCRAPSVPGNVPAMQRPQSASDVSAAEGPAAKRLRSHSARTASSLRPRPDPDLARVLSGLPGSAAVSPTAAFPSVARNGLLGAAHDSLGSAAVSPVISDDAACGIAAASAAASPVVSMPPRRLSSHGLASQLEVLHMPQLPPRDGGQSHASSPATGSRAPCSSPAVVGDSPLSPAIDVVLPSDAARRRLAAAGAFLVAKVEQAASGEASSGQQTAASARPSTSLYAAMAGMPESQQLRAQPDVAAALGTSAAAEDVVMRKDGPTAAPEASTRPAALGPLTRQDDLADPSAAAASEQVCSRQCPTALFPFSRQVLMPLPSITCCTREDSWRH